MRAHFAGIPTTPDSIEDCTLEPPSLENRIMEFKQDTANMEILSEFVDDVLKKAETEATKRATETEKQAEVSQQENEKPRQSFAIPDFKNGKVVNRARGFVVRLFDAICNCANSATAAPTTRFKLRTKRQSSTANQNEDPSSKETKSSKKSENGKNKSKDEKPQEEITKAKVKIDFNLSDPGQDHAD